MIGPQIANFFDGRSNSFAFLATMQMVAIVVGVGIWRFMWRDNKITSLSDIHALQLIDLSIVVTFALAGPYFYRRSILSQIASDEEMEIA